MIRNKAISNMKDASFKFYSKIDNMLSSLKEEEEGTQLLIDRYEMVEVKLKTLLENHSEASVFPEDQSILNKELAEATKKLDQKTKFLTYLKSLDEDEDTKKQMEETLELIKKLQETIQQKKKEISMKKSAAANLVQLGFTELLPFTLSVVAESNQGLTLASFQNVNKLHGGNILKAEREGQTWVLKRFLVGKDDEAKRKFEKEVSILAKLNHPLVIKIESVFYDGLDAYIQMPYYPETLQTFLFGKDAVPGTKTQLPTSKVRNLLQYILHGIAFIHRNGVVHKDLKPTNILMKGTTPIISDFGISKMIEGKKETVTFAGTPEFMAPEVLFGQSGTMASDMWSFGIIAFRAMYGNVEVILDPKQEVVNTPPHHESDTVVPFLASLLCKNSAKRISAEEALYHPFFTDVSEESSNGGTNSSEKKIKALRNFLQTAKSKNIAQINIEAKREEIVPKLFSTIGKLKDARMFDKFLVTFIGEEGIDAGALTTALYREFFEQIFNERHGLFMKAEGGVCYLPKPTDSNESLTKLTNFGKILSKMIIDERIAQVPLATIVFKYLQNPSFKPTMKDLESYDPQMYQGLQKLVALSGSENLGLTFEGLEKGGENIPLNDSNKHRYVSLKIIQILLNTPCLEAIRKGFFNPSIKNHLELFSYTDIRLLLSGNDYISPDAIKSVLKFRNFPENSQIPKFFHQMIDQMSQDDLKRFILFSTEQVSIPITGLSNPNKTSPYPKNVITIVCLDDASKLPESHVCFYRLDVPNCNSLEVLQTKMIQAIYGSDTFQIV